jgi:hypothetical protein
MNYMATFQCRKYGKCPVNLSSKRAYRKLHGKNWRNFRLDETIL